ncbi:ROK family protein [Sneathia sanguinegens]|uniref:ROK family protein n=1 Tax=Sneathia sanguinegens TaxID=40543 RepID=UPI0023FA4126|nr:ROK family protein [Sneathia sanguinegens]
MNILCFDIGGTSIKYTLFTQDNIDNLTILSEKTSSNILEQILNIIEKYPSISAVGISSAGVIDNKQGKVIYAGPTIPNYIGTELKKNVEAKFNVPCIVENDVNSAAYGEYVYNKEKSPVFCLTVGTGVGGAIIINDKIYTGANFSACEIGYLPIQSSYFQDISSTKYLVDLVSKKLNKKVDGLYIFEEAKKGSKLCQEAIEKMVDNLSYGIVNIIYMFNPNKIIIGGGITAQKEILEPLIRKKVNEKLIDKKFITQINLAKLENKAGLYGIYCLTRKEIQ